MGVKWVLSVRGARKEVMLVDGRVKEGPKWAKGLMIDKVLEKVKLQGGSAFCAGVFSTGKVERKRRGTTAPRAITKKSLIRAAM